MKIRKILVALGLILFVAGIAIAAFLTQVLSSTESISLGKWDPIEPSGYISPDKYVGPSWTLEMPEGSLFELNVSASKTVRLKIGTPVYDNLTMLEVSFDSIYDQVGTSFTQEVAVGASRMYTVKIINEGTTTSSIEGYVLAENSITTRQIIYPYSSWGTLVTLGGICSMIYGVLTKPNRRRQGLIQHNVRRAPPCAACATTYRRTKTSCVLLGFRII